MVYKGTSKYMEEHQLSVIGDNNLKQRREKETISFV